MPYRPGTTRSIPIITAGRENHTTTIQNVLFCIRHLSLVPPQLEWEGLAAWGYRLAPPERWVRETENPDFHIIPHLEGSVKGNMQHMA